MPFIVRDPWRLQYFTNVPCPEQVSIAVDDLDCWEASPGLRFVYDKLFIARSQGLACGTHKEMPKAFPVFAKPRVNLHGMGHESFVVADAHMFEGRMRDGLIWVQLLAGAHVSSDCAVIKGRVTWTCHATGEAGAAGTFKHWTIEAKDIPALSQFLSGWIGRVLPDYTGMINIETIGGHIIEAQLRFADQWCDLYGKGWLSAVVGLYSDSTWHFADARRMDAYSIPLFMRHGPLPNHPAAEVQARIRALPHVKSLQITFHENKLASEHTMPPGGFRLAVINVTDFAAGLSARAELAKAFQDSGVSAPALMV